MKKKLAAAVLTGIVCLLATLPALAADVFKFAEQTVNVFVGETVQPELLQDGKFTEGELVFSQNKGKEKVGSVDQTGTVTGIGPGEMYLYADLKKDGKTVKRAQTVIKVFRKVESVTLDTKGLRVYEPDDAEILSLVHRLPEEEEPEGSAEGEETGENWLKDRVLEMSVGKGFTPRITYAPGDVAYAHKKATFEISDESILANRNGVLTALKAGECRLTIHSSQSPEVTETFHVLVVQPVKKIQINTKERTVFAGSTLQIDAEALPAEASDKHIVWSSRKPQTATVDENGLVTGVSRGQVAIDAKSADGTNVTATIFVTVMQDVTGLSIKETDITVATKRTAPNLHVTVEPKDADNKKLLWSSSDESIATVNGYGGITGKKAGTCTVTCTSASNPSVSASIPVRVIQMVTEVRFLTPAGQSFNVGDSIQLDWTVLPDDASIKDVTFSSKNEKVAVVDANGIVTGISRGQADIVAKATDGSGKSRSYRVSVIQPVEGINPMGSMYYAPLYRGYNLKATVYPSNANNQRILWSSSDTSVATIKSVGTSYGQVYGRRRGWVTITATTEDGGFSTSTNVQVDDFDGMVFCQSAYIDENNKIRMTIVNMSQEFSVSRVNMRVECYDTWANPMICNTDGVSTSFDASYTQSIYPGGRSAHGQFRFINYKENGMLGYAVITVTGYELENGQRWSVPENVQKELSCQSRVSSHMWEPTLAPPIVTEE